MDWEKVTPALSSKLDPAHIKKPTGQYGPKGDYLEGWFVIQEANRVFGFGGWSYTITSLTRDSLESVEKNGKSQWQSAYTCVVKVTVGDVVREDVGFGSGFAANVGDAIEGATKESVTDALKRCLRTFGNVFGLALYDKARENVGRPEPTNPLDDMDAFQKEKAAAIEAIGQQATRKHLVNYWTQLVANQRAVALDGEVIAAKDKRKKELEE